MVFLIGPERSGSSLHIDPLATSAWNTLIRGRKRWVLFHPSTPKKLAKGEDLRQKGEDSEGITWFERTLPRIIEQEQKNPNGPQLGMVEFIQYPGETVFVPGGWWHAVVNLDDTVAVTQNFVSITNFPKVWKKTRKGRKHMAKRWLETLEHKYPELAKIAHTMNKDDGFEFKFSHKKHKKSKKRSRSHSRSRSRSRSRSPKKRSK